MKKSIVIVSLVLLAGVFACIFLIFPNRDQGAQAIAQDYWPERTWRTSTPEEQGMDSNMLADMINAVSKSGINVNSITIIRNGYLVNETCFYPYQKDMKHALNSCTKSFISALTGAAIEQGAIKSVDDKVLDYFPDLSLANVDEHKRDMGIRNLLSMTTGLDWQFVGDVSTGEMSQSNDWAKFTLDLPMREEPGQTFNYCNGASNVMSDILQRATGKSASELFSEKFKALGITDYYWSSSPENTSAGYSGIFMRADDMAKIGYLYLKKGNWNGKQLVPEKWVQESTKLQVSADWNPIFPGYGYMWWVTRFGGYAALGYGGNYIFVVPNMNLVVVFTGGIFDNAKLFYPGELMEKYIIPSVISDTPLHDSEASALLSKAVDAVQNAPVPKPAALPEIASRISDKTYTIEGMGTVILHFPKGGNEFTFDLSSQTYTAGLDGAFRISDVGGNGSLPDHNHYAIKGSWPREDTLQIEIRSLEDGFIKVYSVHFVNDSIEITAKANIGPDEAYSGKLE